MNNTLTNEEIARVFAMYLGQKCTDWVNIVTYNAWLLHMCRFDLKLLLTPLELISDEDAIEVAKMCMLPDATKFHTPEYGRTFLDDFNWETYQYLISKGYAVPLFFVPSHWANGKTAIELGIAIKK